MIGGRVRAVVASPPFLGQHRTFPPGARILIGGASRVRAVVADDGRPTLGPGLAGVLLPHHRGADGRPSFNLRWPQVPRPVRTSMFALPEALL